MKKNKKIILSIILFLVAIFAFAGCGKEEKNTLSINYVIDGQVYSSVTVAGDSRITLLEPQTDRVGVVFDGWYIDESKTIKFTEDYLVNNPIKKSINVYGFWITDSSQYVVRFYKNQSDTDVYKESGVAEGNTVSEPDAPTTVGYIFDGWYNGDNLFDFNMPITNNLSLFAKWTPISYYIEYDGNGATDGAMHDSVFAYNNADGLRKNAYIRPLYIFLGWSLDKNATDIDYYDEQNVMNLTDVSEKTITLYAIWEKEEGLFTASLDYKGGKDSLLNTSSVIEFSNQMIDYPTVTNGNQILFGWTENEGTNVLFDYRTATDNVSLYAVWGNLDFSSANDTDILAVQTNSTTESFINSCEIVADELASDGYALKVSVAANSSWKKLYFNLGENVVNSNSIVSINVRTNNKKLSFYSNVGVGHEIAYSTKLSDSELNNFYYSFNITGFNDNEVLTTFYAELANNNATVFYIDSILISTFDTDEDFVIAEINENNYKNAYISNYVGWEGNHSDFTQTYLATYEGKTDIVRISLTIPNNGWKDINIVPNLNYNIEQLNALKELGYIKLKFSFRTDNGNFNGIFNGKNGSSEIDYSLSPSFAREQWIDVEISIDTIIVNYANILHNGGGTKFLYSGKGNYTGNTITTNYYFTEITLSK